MMIFFQPLRRFLVIFLMYRPYIMFLLRMYTSIIVCQFSVYKLYIICMINGYFIILNAIKHFLTATKPILTIWFVA